MDELGAGPPSADFGINQFRPYIAQPRDRVDQDYQECLEVGVFEVGHGKILRRIICLRNWIGAVGFLLSWSQGAEREIGRLVKPNGMDTHSDCTSKARGTMISSFYIRARMLSRAALQTWAPREFYDCWEFNLVFRTLRLSDQLAVLLHCHQR